MWCSITEHHLEDSSAEQQFSIPFFSGLFLTISVNSCTVEENGLGSIKANTNESSFSTVQYVSSGEVTKVT